MVEIPLEYWNKLATQLITVSSVLGGFSIAVIANLLVYNSDKRITNNILKVATIASGCFLINVFAMTQMSMMTTKGHPVSIVQGDLILPRAIGFLTFFLGIVSLTTIIAMSGWTKSRKIGMFTTSVGIVVFLMTLITMIQVRL